MSRVVSNIPCPKCGCDIFLPTFVCDLNVFECENCGQYMDLAPNSDDAKKNIKEWMG